MSIRKGQTPVNGAYWLCGVHAVSAALANPRRKVRRLLAAPGAEGKLSGYARERHPAFEPADSRAIEQALGAQTVHQGIVALVEPLPVLDLHELLESAPSGPLVVLDQVSDPHNVGAIIRSAAAFDAAAVIVTERHAPSENAVIAKAASGGLEVVPLVSIGNLAQALEVIKKAGYWVAGLDGAAQQTIDQAKLDAKTALVLGAEGTGLRRLTAERCDLLVRLPISAKMESLNVSNATAVALYALYTASR